MSSLFDSTIAQVKSFNWKQRNLVFGQLSYFVDYSFIEPSIYNVQNIAGPKRNLLVVPTYVALGPIVYVAKFFLYTTAAFFGNSLVQIGALGVDTLFQLITAYHLFGTMKNSFPQDEDFTEEQKKAVLKARWISWFNIDWTIVKFLLNCFCIAYDYTLEQRQLAVLVE